MKTKLVTFFLLSNLFGIHLWAAPTVVIKGEDGDGRPVTEQDLAVNNQEVECEFYVNAFARGSQYVYHGAGYSFVEAHLKINKFEQKLLDNVVTAGMYAYLNQDGVDREVLVVGREINHGLDGSRSGEFIVGLRTDSSIFGVQVQRQISHLAFFIDVQGEDGMNRIWLKNGNEDFTPESIWGTNPPFQINPYNNGGRDYQYLDGRAPSVIFNKKRQCNFY